MSRRSTSSGKRNELVFPFRVKFVVPDTGLGFALDRMLEWLQREIGREDSAHGSQPGMGCSTLAVYFRRVDDLVRFLDAFPDAKLADGVGCVPHRDIATIGAIGT